MPSDSSEHEPSQHGARFNHDHQAYAYDADVADESNPIRTGYSAALAWVARECNGAAPERVLELGCGSGNLTARLTAPRITAVDNSYKMLALAAEKSDARQEVHYVQADMLAFARALAPSSFNAVASTFALHHLSDPEKQTLLGLLAHALRPAGRIVIADLMFACAADRERILAGLTRTAQVSLARGICDEFFWDVELSARWLADLGLAVKWTRVSELTWCFCATSTIHAIPDF